MKSLTVTVDLIPFDADTDAEAHCPRCDVPLEFHQPDIQSPDRLLGTCLACDSWFLRNCVTSMMVLLPMPSLLG